MNIGYLAQYGVNAVVTGINLDAGKHTVLVQVSAKPTNAGREAPCEGLSLPPRGCFAMPGTQRSHRGTR